MKYIEIHKQTNRVHRVEDTLPSNSAEASVFTECSDDSVQEGWWVNPADNSLNTQKTWDVEEARAERNRLLAESDWLVLEDSPAHADPSVLAAMKTYRQTLRDVTSHDPILDEHIPIRPGF